MYCSLVAALLDTSSTRSTNHVPALDHGVATAFDPRSGRREGEDTEMPGDHANALMGVPVRSRCGDLPCVRPADTGGAIIVRRNLVATHRVGKSGNTPRSAAPARRADIHLTLVPLHLLEQPITVVLFLLDAIALLPPRSLHSWRRAGGPRHRVADRPHPRLRPVGARRKVRT